MTDRHKTSHLICIGDAANMPEIDEQSVDLVVTSPPYPMIQMWDDLFSSADPEIGNALDDNNGAEAFERMHRVLEPVWREVHRVMKPGGILCVNIGDATRTINGSFHLFPNHAQTIMQCLGVGFTQLPTIIWHKPTNAPNKFMGSGMLPPGAYVTLEHEYILIFRKGQKREFDQRQKIARRKSAYFWEERNAWFSDVWFDLRGTSQKSKRQQGQKRTGAFPLDLPFRLIHMFSIHGDMVVDPFLGSGTTMFAAMCSGRNSIGYEIDAQLQPGILEKIADVPEMAHQFRCDRLDAHRRFIEERGRSKGGLNYVNQPHGFYVMTKQEEDLYLPKLRNVQYQSSLKFSIEYEYGPESESEPSASVPEGDPHLSSNRPPKGRQMKLF